MKYLFLRLVTGTCEHEGTLGEQDTQEERYRAYIVRTRVSN
jgi:hypothetical protein